MFKRYVGLCLLLCAQTLYAKSSLITQITKTNQSQWQVEYQAVEPVTSIQFAISPDNSRLSRWQLLDSEFTFFTINGREVITRRDSKPFERVKLSLTPTYIHLPKYYAPFSPYSDGGMLIHSSRFFACANLCASNENHWYFSLKVPDDEYIYLNGEIRHGAAQWWDANDGTKVFIGKQSKEQGHNYVSIIDQGLPENIRKNLKDFFPKMMTSLESVYGKLKTKPMLYASFGKTDEALYGRQGGVLPNQVFMHWYGQTPEPSDKEQAELLWFFAHEAAHLYQGKMKGRSTEGDAWLHEGHAEFVAMQLMKELAPHLNEYSEKKLYDAQAQCHQYVNSDNALEAEPIRFSAHYQCGLVIFDFLAQQMLNEKAVADLWLTFVRRSKQPHFNATQSFLNLVDKSLAPADYKKLEALIQPLHVR